MYKIIPAKNLSILSICRFKIHCL